MQKLRFPLLATLLLAGACPSGKGKQSPTLSTPNDATTTAPQASPTVTDGVNLFLCTIESEPPVTAPCTIESKQGESQFSMTLPDTSVLSGTLSPSDYGFTFAGSIESKISSPVQIHSDFFRQGKGGFATMVIEANKRPWGLTLSPTPKK